MAVVSTLDLLGVLCPTLFILLSVAGLGDGESVLGVENDDFDFDGLPGVQHELRFEVGAGEMECFYQNMPKLAQVYFSFEVSSSLNFVGPLHGPGLLRAVTSVREAQT